MGIPCKGCKYNTYEDDKLVKCKFYQLFGNSKEPSIDRGNKIENNIEIVPKSIFFKHNVCAAKTV